MNLPLSIALRYLRGRGSVNAVPILSRISMLAIAVGAAAMIILFSVFNGFEGLVQDLYKAFYPDIRITPTSGKFFAPSASLIGSLQRVPGVQVIAPVIEDNALAANGDETMVVYVKGVDSRYFRVNNLKPYVAYGADTITEGRDESELGTALLGIEIAGRLGLTPDNDFSKLQLNYPNSKSENLLANPTDAFQTLRLRTGGIFQVQSDFDEHYIVAPLASIQSLLREEGNISSLEIKVDEKANLKQLEERIRQAAGPALKVETRFQQNRTLYGVMRTEKWATYVILLFILLIASVNMIGALALLVLEKTKDAAILSAMGAGRRSIRRIFLLEGILWSALGGISGIIVGALVCLAQKQWGLVHLQEGAFLVKDYPVAMQAMDFVIVFITVLAVGLIASIYPALKAGRRPTDGGLSTGMR